MPPPQRTLDSRSAISSSGSIRAVIPGERTKNGLLHRVPLCPMAKAEFARAIAATLAKGPYVFASTDNLRAHVTPLSITRGMARLVNELKISTASPHDLRRTVGTEMARLGIPVHVGLIFRAASKACAVAKQGRHDRPRTRPRLPAGESGRRSM